MRKLVIRDFPKNSDTMHSIKMNRCFMTMVDKGFEIQYDTIVIYILFYFKFPFDNLSSKTRYRFSTPAQGRYTLQYLTAMYVRSK